MTNIVFKSKAIVRDADAPVVGGAFEIQSVDRVFQVDLTGVGASASVVIDVSCNGEKFVPLYTVDLYDEAMAGEVSAAISSSDNFNYVRARVVSINAGTVSVFAGD